MNKPSRKMKITKNKKINSKKLMDKGMDKVKAKWYANAWATWTIKDYEKYLDCYMEMFGITDNQEGK